MKTLAVATAASSMLMTTAAMAQKVAVVNFQEVMAKIPQTAAVMQTLESEFKDEQAVIKQLESDLKYNLEKKKRDSSIMSKKDQEALDKKIAELNVEYQTKGQALQQKAQARQNEETSKIVALIRQAVDNIAAKNKYDVVIEQKSVVFAKPDSNITEQVVEQVSKLN
jgi:outer membrane protein